MELTDEKSFFFVAFFYSAVRISDCMMLNDRIIGEELNRNDLEGSS
jgi:hypothetical protein